MSAVSPFPHIFQREDPFASLPEELRPDHVDLSQLKPNAQQEEWGHRAGDAANGQYDAQTGKATDEGFSEKYREREERIQRLRRKQDLERDRKRQRALRLQKNARDMDHRLRRKAAQPHSAAAVAQFGEMPDSITIRTPATMGTPATLGTAGGPLGKTSVRYTRELMGERITSVVRRSLSRFRDQGRISEDNAAAFEDISQLLVDRIMTYEIARNARIRRTQLSESAEARQQQKAYTQAIRPQFFFKRTKQSVDGIRKFISSVFDGDTPIGPDYEATFIECYRSGDSAGWKKSTDVNVEDVHGMYVEEAHTAADAADDDW
eukprot:gnl/Dysnectes_brevis/2584_a3115_1923.p1 GENE.gnl/Dysnectes_brevis/2584_a3115_1923~~gnl/Dysnectes_brevis/2584_a3115_1923.p1  ORF type:complete len:320 (-),score=73.04 gnl/Dysnectes_brevis/2584_a3115_1923:224-1183(-)